MSLSAVRSPQFQPSGEFDTEVVPLNAWAASTAYVVGQIVRSGASSGHYYQCTVAGTSNSTAPTWTTTGTTVSDNNVTWQDIGAGNGGDLVLRPNGLVAYIDGLQPLDYQTSVSFRYVRTGYVPKGATHFADGSEVWLNTATGLAVASAPAQGFIVGTARGDAATAATQVLVVLNDGAGLLFSANTLTFSGLTGANTIVFPTSEAAGLVIEDASSNVALTLNSTAQTATWSVPVYCSASTPIISTQSGTSNTGYLQCKGKTSAGVRLTCADAMGYNLIVSAAAVATADRTLTLPDPGAADSFVYLALAGELTNKTLTAGIIKTGLTASGSAANDFSGSTGTFLTSTGTNTFGGNTAHKCGASATAAGADQAGATPLNEGDQVLVTGVTGQTGYGVKFPSASFAGKRVIVQNITTYACKLYPYSTENIGAGASTAVTVAASHAYLVVWSAAGVGRVWDLGAVIAS